MENKRSTGPAAVVLEVGVALILVVLILGTLNYFGIIPVSRTLPFLSFLPQQQIDNGILQNSKQEARNTLRANMKAMVMPFNPLITANNTERPMSKYIASSSAQVKTYSVFRVDAELLTGLQATTSGIVIYNGEKYGDKEYRHIAIYRNMPSRAWTLEYMGAGQKKYFFLTRASNGFDFKKFAIIISADGTTLEVLSTAFPSRKIVLPGTLYTDKRQIGANVQVGAKSTLTIFSLYYTF